MEGGSLELGIWDLPDDCISHIFSLTSPREACRCSAVSSAFRSAAESDAVWERFLPPNWEDIISKSSSPVEFSSLKAVYFHLCDYPILVDQGKKSFALDKESGKFCYMLGPEDMSIRWLHIPCVWNGKLPMPYAYEYDKTLKSRFSEVHHVNDVTWLQIHGRIQMQLLSPNTTYAAYLVYAPRPVGFKYPLFKVSVRFACNGVENRVGEVSDEAYLLPEMSTPKEGVYRGWDRSDKWMEVKMGEFFNGEDDVEVEVEMCFWEVREFAFVYPYGLDLQGIEIRPKDKRTK
ncbi:hypothetical protein FNV43_RR02303 [Rhamnella rubrinervis]|uniref:F-box domain-containing protein n=1 Tax=Rhamnella rubrinervis TaxID=2594499 RepID=A0A8K0HS21_9ROSA|nr:hypothetical protein FNV43_RR02303 [Rhamnella rubrinervis]